MFARPRFTHEACDNTLWLGGIFEAAAAPVVGYGPWWSRAGVVLLLPEHRIELAVDERVFQGALSGSQADFASVTAAGAPQWGSAGCPWRQSASGSCLHVVSARVSGEIGKPRTSDAIATRCLVRSPLLRIFN